MGLQAQLPLRMGAAKGNGELGITGAVGTVHWLHGKPPEAKVSEVERIEAGLRNHDFELVTLFDDEAGARFLADAYPVEAGRRENCAVGLDRDLEAATVQCIDQPLIELQ